ncbi:MAG: hypothetical protein NTY99_00070 [DPANN group archaeon]|nr:hypothetical protein [DPANN group archaeon]
MGQLYWRFRHWAKKELPANIKVPTFFPRINFRSDVLWFVEGNIFGLLIGFTIGFVLITLKIF